MRQVNSTDFKSHFGAFVDEIRDQPIAVLRGSRPIGIFLSPEEYEHLQRIEDAYWGAQAEAAVARGDFLSPDDAMRWITQRLSKGK